MNASAKFRDIGISLDKMMYMVITNQNILRYVKYLDNDPLSTDKPDVGLSDIKGQITPDMFDEKVMDQTRVMVFFHPMEGNLEAIPLGQDYYLLDIIVPKDFWILQGKGEFRAFQIAQEIANKLDGKNVAGIGEIDIVKWKTYKIDNSFKGLTLWVKVTTVTRY